MQHQTHRQMQSMTNSLFVSTVFEHHPDGKFHAVIALLAAAVATFDPNRVTDPHSDFGMVASQAAAHVAILYNLRQEEEQNSDSFIV